MSERKTEDIECQSTRRVWMEITNRSLRTMQGSLGIYWLHTEGFLFQGLNRRLAQEGNPKTSKK